jgi:hypothetical protein
MVAAALIDRLVHHPTMVTLKGKSYRLRERGAASRPPPSLPRYATPPERRTAYRVVHLTNSRWTSNPTLLTRPPFPAVDGGEPVGKRQRRIRAHSTPRPVAEAATEKSGSKPIAQETARPACVPQTAPVPVSRTYGPSRTPPSKRQFHAPKGNRRADAQPARSRCSVSTRAALLPPTGTAAIHPTRTAAIHPTGTAAIHGRGPRRARIGRGGHGKDQRATPCIPQT